MRKRSVTLTDIANKLDLDVSTVSKALNDHPKISDATKEKVREVAKQLQYSRNNIATALVKGKSNLIGVMVPHTDENFFASVIRGIYEVVKDEDYRIVIFQSYDSTEVERENIECMLRTQVDGIIASHAMETEEFDHYQDVLDQGISIVLFDRYNDVIESDVVAIDDFKGAYKAVCHLIDQGCENIAHISGYHSVHIYNERVRGYEQALNDNDIPYDPNNVYESDMTLEGGRKIASAILEKGVLPDAIFCSNDYTALGAIQVFKEGGVIVPDQVAIAGFSNEAFAGFVTPSITSVDQHSMEMGKVAAHQLLRQIENQMETATKELPKKTILTPELIVRDSSFKKQVMHS